MREVDKGNGWKVQEILEPDGKRRHTKYFYKHKRAPRILITSKMAEQLAGYALIEKDLRNVLLWLQEIDRIYPHIERPNKTVISPDRERFTIIKALYVAALTFYGKCFTKCEGRRIKLDKKIMDDKYKELHDNIMHMRHNYAAHSGADNFEEVKVALVLYPSKRSKLPPILYKELTQPDVILKDPGDDVGFSDLIEHLQSKVLEKIVLLDNKIMSEEIIPKGKDYWYKKGK